MLDFILQRLENRRPDMANQTDGIVWDSRAIDQTSCPEKPIDISSFRIYNLLELIEGASVEIESCKNEFHRSSAS